MDGIGDVVIEMGEHNGHTHRLEFFAELLAETARVHASAERTLAVAAEWEAQRPLREFLNPPKPPVPPPVRPLLPAAEREAVEQWAQRSMATERAAMDQQSDQRQLRQFVAGELEKLATVVGDEVGKLERALEARLMAEVATLKAEVEQLKAELGVRAELDQIRQQVAVLREAQGRLVD